VTAYRVGLLIGRTLAAILRALDRRPPTQREHDQWVRRMRAVADAQALEAAIARHPAGKRRPR
jgi:hypothetical protein